MTDSVLYPKQGAISSEPSASGVVVPANLPQQQRIHDKYGYRNVIGVSSAMVEVLETMQRVARSSVSAMILGESGTGKELIARSLHYASQRRGKPFVPVNCVSIPENLVESVLFGHVKGAFTGAHETRKGLFEVANGGTVFLDEIGDMSLAAQAKLLRVLQERCITRVGDTAEIPIDIRVITATHKDLGAMLTNGTFREDLFYRMNVLPVELPPLRERREDIPLLAYHILDELDSEGIVEHIEGFTQRALNKLVAYDWPGNVRELRNALERAALFARGGVIDARDLKLGLSRAAAAPETAEGYRAGKARVLQQFEKEYLCRMITAANGNISEAARRAGLDRSHFYQLLKRNGIAVPTRRKADNA